MNRYFKRAVELLHRDQFYIGRAIKPNQISKFLTDMRPVSTDRNLIRLGPKGDGGYLIPDDFDGVVACVSPGVSTECGFDEQMSARGIDVYMADASVDAPAVSNPRFHFVKKFFDTYTSDRTVTIDDFCKGIPGDGDLILQMDIEGAEYRVIYGMSDDLLKRFRIITIEFHDVEGLFAPPSFRLMEPAFAKLTRYHNVVHIHPNNNGSLKSFGKFQIPTMLEITFYRKDRAQVIGRPAVFPHPLDANNVTYKPSLALPRCWFE